MLSAIWYHLYNLKHEKNLWRSVTFSKVASFMLLHGGFLRFLNCADDNKPCKASHII